MADRIPPLPAGFKLDQPIPPLPDGYTLDTEPVAPDEQQTNSNVDLIRRAQQQADRQAMSHRPFTVPKPVRVLRRLPGNIVKSIGANVTKQIAGAGQAVSETGERVLDNAAGLLRVPVPAIAARSAQLSGAARAMGERAREFAGVYREAALGAEEAIPKDAGVIERGIQQGVSSAAVSFPVVAATGPFGGALLLSTGAAADRYGELRAAGLSPQQAVASAQKIGALEAATAFLPGRALVKKVPGFWKHVAEFVAVELPGENLNTIGRLVDDYAQGLRENVTKDDVIAALLDTTVATVISSGTAHVMQGAVDVTNRITDARSNTSDDLEAAAKNTGPKAERAYTRATNFYRAGSKRLDSIRSVIDRHGGPENVFKAATSGTKEGAKTLRAVMQSLPADAQKTVSATVLRRLGRAKPGQQDNLGEAFSTETFLTNWDGMSTEAKAVLFNRYGPGFRQNMDRVARIAANLREGSDVFRNSSGTSQRAAQTTAAAFFLPRLTGELTDAGLIASGVTGASLDARLMTKPKFVRWLAKTTRAPVNAVPALTHELLRSSDSDMRQFAEALRDRQQQQAHQGNGR